MVSLSRRKQEKALVQEQIERRALQVFFPDPAAAQQAGIAYSEGDARSS